MPRYFLSSHSYACETGGHAVFLDLKSQQYMAVSPEDVETLRMAVRGWPSVQATLKEGTTLTAAPHARRTLSTLGLQDATDGLADLTAAPADPSDDILQVLIKEGLITADAALGKEAVPAQLDIATETFVIPQRPWPILNKRHLANFIAQWAMTSIRLKTLPMGWIVNRVRRRKEARAHLTGPLDIRRARVLTMIHFMLRPAFYDTKDACLRDSLTLIEFLACYDIYPQWVFGVRVEPFSAHAWVQSGPMLFTDPVEHIKTFTPIMVI